MKKTILSSILLLSSTTIFADTTMCFKENHKSMSTIENTPLDGGACASKYSVTDMKAKGWSVDDIKISQTANGMNFIYILKTASSSSTVVPVVAGNQADMEARIVEKLEKKKVEEEKAKVEKELKDAQVDAQKIYTTKCQSCHGEKGEKSAYNTSRPLKNLSVEQMNDSIKDYKNGAVASQNAILMAPYANYVNENILKGIHGYLNKINNK